jgi:glycosyltransferase involved in cell wall biosynthesis
VVVPNPVDLELGALCIHRTNAPALLFLSRLDPKKGLDLLLPAFARVLKRHPTAHLTVAGHGPAAFVDGLKQQAHELRIQPSVAWAGFLQGEEKIRAFARADLFVLPSHSENFGLAVVEAMGAGLPVVVSDQVGIHREISSSGAGLVAECTVDSLEAALLRLLSDPDLRASMAQRGAALARTFSRDAVVEQLAEVYAQIRTGRRQPIAA